MTDENDTDRLALAVMTKAFCDWCQWAAKVAGFETDDGAELRDGVEEKIRTAKREGYMEAARELWDDGQHLSVLTLTEDEVDAIQAPGDDS